MTSDDPVIRVSGVVINGANAGNVRLRWTMDVNSSGGGDSVLVLANSVLRAGKL